MSLYLVHVSWVVKLVWLVWLLYIQVVGWSLREEVWHRVVFTSILRLFCVFLGVSPLLSDLGNMQPVWISLALALQDLIVYIILCSFMSQPSMFNFTIFLSAEEMYDFHLFINLPRTCSIIFTYILKNVNTRICTPLLLIYLYLKQFSYKWVCI